MSEKYRQSDIGDEETIKERNIRQYLHNNQRDFFNQLNKMRHDILKVQSISSKSSIEISPEEIEAKIKTAILNFFIDRANPFDLSLVDFDKVNTAYDEMCNEKEAKDFILKLKELGLAICQSNNTMLISELANDLRDFYNIVTLENQMLIHLFAYELNQITSRQLFLIMNDVDSSHITHIAFLPGDLIEKAKTNPQIQKFLRICRLFER